MCNMGMCMQAVRHMNGLHALVWQQSAAAGYVCVHGRLSVAGDHAHKHASSALEVWAVVMSLDMLRDGGLFAGGSFCRRNCLCSSPRAAAATSQ